MFQRFYSKALSRRLVFGNYASMESEESMVQKLKVTKQVTSVALSIIFTVDLE